MRPLISLLAASLLATAACGDNSSSLPKDAALADDASLPTDAGVDGSPAIGPCLDRPTDLPRPPSGQLPCELYPPGFGQ
ncbi:MAG TPA: hypothetical protein VM734_17770 [Kofleriaceae bacterium]|jgi:hypothetical protein|nr:hypothetical protein [Kofleriaceae bacterium]